MRIFEQELTAGITQLSNRVVADCNVLTCSEFDGEVTDAISKTIAAYVPSNPNQFDLHYLTCILVSLGWNKNDDVFDKQELWSARFSPEDKPFNYMHDETDIIGHMTGSVVIDKDGNQIAPDTDFDSLPDHIDILTSAVIYKAWSDVEQSLRVKELIEAIQENEWCVSMECLFKNFDYALISPDGTHKVISRDNESAFLTKHLRAYGGSGEYDGYKVGRLLRNISFSGIGLVKRPANPRSVIVQNENILGEALMTTTNHTAASDNTDVVQSLETSVAELNEKIATLTTSHAEALSLKDTEINDLKTQLSTAKQECASITEQMQNMQKELVAIKRRAVLASMDLCEEDILDMLMKFENMDEEVFSNVVAVMKKVKPVTVSAKVEDTVDDSAATDTVDTEEVVDPEEVEDASIAQAGQVDMPNIQSALAAWFEQQLVTTKNSK